MSTLGDWVYTPFPPFQPTLFPNIAFWNATSASNNLTYQIQVCWPFEWESRQASNKSALTMYVLDGNAMGMTAAEGFKRRQPVAFGQPDSVVVSIGYPLTESVYDFTHRVIDYRPPRPTPQDYPSGADAFINFLDGSLRPWLHSTVFPSVTFTRDALFGHSFGGLFVVYALILHPYMFDTYLSASPALDWQNGSIFEMVTRAFGTVKDPLVGSPLSTSVRGDVDRNITLSQPAVVISYGSLEEFPVRRRTETQQQFQTRKDFFKPLRMTENCHELFDRLKASGKTRDLVLKEYFGQDHAGVAASAITDGIDYFVDW